MENAEYAGPEVADLEKKKKKQELDVIGGSVGAFKEAKNKAFGYGDASDR